MQAVRHESRQKNSSTDLVGIHFHSKSEVQTTKTVSHQNHFFLRRYSCHQIQQRPSVVSKAAQLVQTPGVNARGRQVKGRHAVSGSLEQGLHLVPAPRPVAGAVY
ncbi:hypothetical protein OROHE_002379 [Orobanche hederae]